MLKIHATCVAFENRGILLQGPSGSGKSDLALRLIEDGARLVADDQVEVHAREDGRLEARAPDRIAGLLEVRGLGIIKMDHLETCTLVLAVDLVDASLIERMPDAAFTSITGGQLRQISLAPYEASAPAKLRQALRLVQADALPTTKQKAGA